MTGSRKRPKDPDQLAAEIVRLSAEDEEGPKRSPLVLQQVAHVEIADPSDGQAAASAQPRVNLFSEISLTDEDAAYVMVVLFGDAEKNAMFIGLTGFSYLS